MSENLVHHISFQKSFLNAEHPILSICERCDGEMIHTTKYAENEGASSKIPSLFKIPGPKYTYSIVLQWFSKIEHTRKKLNQNILISNLEIGGEAAGQTDPDRIYIVLQIFSPSKIHKFQIICAGSYNGREYDFWAQIYCRMNSFFRNTKQKIFLPIETKVYTQSKKRISTVCFK